MSARLKSNASMKIERELERKIKDKEQRARLDKVLGNAQLKLKTDVDMLKKNEAEKKAKVEDRLEMQRKRDRIAKRMADKKREEDDINRQKTLKEV